MTKKYDPGYEIYEHPEDLFLTYINFPHELNIFLINGRHERQLLSQTFILGGDSTNLPCTAKTARRQKTAGT